VLAITRPDGLGDVANLGMTLAEAKQLLAQVQQQVVAAQVEPTVAKAVTRDNSPSRVLPFVRLLRPPRCGTASAAP
jgi:hypothetical protein